MSDTSGFEPFSRRPLADLIAERIVAAIVNGTFKSGDRLPSEPQLAREMGVGRSSLREAISKLQVTGAVEVVRGRGTFIRGAPEDDPGSSFVIWSSKEGFAMAELLEARIGLEATAAGLACARASSEDLKHLLEMCMAHEECHLQGNLDGMVSTDEQVHHALIRAAHNHVLQEMYSPLVPRFAEFRRKTLALAGAGQRSSEDHRAIHAAVSERNPGKARKAVVVHLWTLYTEVLSGATAKMRLDSPPKGYGYFI